MYETSELYKTILSNPLNVKETKLEIDGVEYTEANIVSAEIPPSGLYESFGIGNCVARELDIEIFPLGEIPRQAEIKVFVRLVLGNQTSEWIPQGVFYISKRQKNKLSGSLSITAFDAMLKAESEWIPEDFIEIFGDITVSNRMDIQDRNGFDIVVGFLYTVFWNGVPYVFECYENETGTTRYLGTRDDPIGIEVHTDPTYDKIVFIVRQDGQHTLSIWEGDNFPMPMADAALKIAHLMGVGLDERSGISNQFSLSYPTEEDEPLTMREVLSGIAVANAGNWSMTFDGNLILIGATSIPKETNILVTETGDEITFGGVKISV